MWEITIGAGVFLFVLILALLLGAILMLVFLAFTASGEH